MKIVRFGPPGREKPGVLDANYRVRDVSLFVDDWTGATLSRESIERIATIEADRLPLVEAGVRLGPPVARVGNFIAIGLNYVDHAEETGAKIPKEPILFTKAPSSIVGPNDHVVLPAGSAKLDWEVELAIVIGAPAYRVSEERALDVVAGYTICNDVSERAWQMECGGQWTKGKSAPTFGPLGPWLVTPDEVPDPGALDLTLDLNGERMQAGSTAKMIFGPAVLIAYVSGFMALEPGDVITTGTPAGVGLARTPQRFLTPGDRMRLSITGLGTQEQIVVPETTGD